MIERLIHIIAASALVACGSKPSPKPATPMEPAHVDTGSGSAVATEPAAKQPDVPAEPPRPDPAKLKADLLAAETAAFATARPVFEKACAACHTKAGKKAAKKKLDHFDMDTYPFGGHHTATIGFTIRDVLGISGKKPKMPYDKPGSVQGDDLAAIKAWTDAWEAAEKGGAHPSHGPDKDDD